LEEKGVNMKKNKQFNYIVHFGSFDSSIVDKTTGAVLDLSKDNDDKRTTLANALCVLKGIKG